MNYFEEGPARAAVGTFPYPHQPLLEAEERREIMRRHLRAMVNGRGR